MRSDRDRHGIAVIAGVVVIVGLLLGVRIIAGSGPKPDERNCVGTPVASTVIVIDRSDNVSGQTLAEIRNRTSAYVRDSTVENELVSVFTVSDLTAHSLTPLVSLCKPRRTGNRLIENPRLLERHFRDTFDKPVSEALESVSGPSPQSPLTQAFVDLSLTPFLGAPRNRLVVFSDMMEHTSAFSLYRCNQQGMLEAFRASRRGAVERPRFVNTYVSLHMIPRLGISPTSLECRHKFWAWFFGDNSGATAGVDVRDLPGGPLPPRS